MEPMTTQELVDQHRALAVAARAYHHPAAANAADAKLEKIEAVLDVRAAAGDVTAQNFLYELRNPY
jgi:hypothetical protein